MAANLAKAERADGSVLSGDFNCSPEVWRTPGLLEFFGLIVLTVGGEHTCKTSSGSSLLDYIVCDTDIAPFIGNVSPEPMVTWGPHSALKCSVNRRPEYVTIQQLRKPKPLPWQLNSKGQPDFWHISAGEWEALHNGFRHSAEQLHKRDFGPHGIWSHADSILLQHRWSGQCGTRNGAKQ